MGVNHKKAQIRVASLAKTPHKSPEKIEALTPGKTYQISFYNRHKWPHRFYVVSSQFDPVVVSHLGLQRGEKQGYIPPAETYLLKSDLIQPGKYEELNLKVPAGVEKLYIISTHPNLVGSFQIPLFVKSSGAPLSSKSEKL